MTSAKSTTEMLGNGSGWLIRLCACAYLYIKQNIGEEIASWGILITSQDWGQILYFRTNFYDNKPGFKIKLKNEW